MNLEIVSSSEEPALYASRDYWEEIFRELGVWPPMLRNDVIAQRYSSEIDRHFPEFQLLAIEHTGRRRVVGIAHSVPLYAGTQIDNLPDTGWDWALETAVTNVRYGATPDSLCGLSISVLPDVQHNGIGRALISRLLSLTSKLRLLNLLMPVRPISKADNPLVPMEQFIRLRREDGFHQDAWIRTHEKAGGKLLQPCVRSMTIVASLTSWEKWSEQRFLRSGWYIVKGCLAPVQVDVERGLGTYCEPNVWVRYTTC